MTATLFMNADLLTPDERRSRTALLIDGGKIVALGVDAEVENAERLDMTGYVLTPGFIDIHVHGGGGHSLTGCYPDAIEAYGRRVTRFGVTGYLAGVIGSSATGIERSLTRGAPAVITQDKAANGAALLGFHLEGPFLSPKRRGAFSAGWLLPPEPALVERFVAAAGGGLRLITMAPELLGAAATIAAAVGLGTGVSLGHTDADYREMLAGFELGARHVTHCFNAMRPFAHRDPGPIAAALTAPGVLCEVIADGEHVAPGALRLLLAARGSESTVLVTDGIELAGATAGSFQLTGETVKVHAGKALTPEGTLAGSVATMDACVRNAVKLGGSTLLEAVRMASLNPARAAGFAGSRGRLAPGYRADIVVLDSDLQVAATWAGGRRVYAAGAFAAG